MKRALYILTSPIWFPVAAVVMGVYYFGLVPIMVVGIFQQFLTGETRVLDWMDANL